MTSLVITKDELDTSDKQQEALMNVDKTLVSLRKNALFDTLKSASDARISMIGRMQKWIVIMEDKLFSKQFLDELSAKETIGLFKYINNINMKLIDKIDKLELILNGYMKVDNPVLNNAGMTSTVEQVDELNSIKKELYKNLNVIMRDNSIDAEIVKDDSIKPEISEDVFGTEIKQQLDELDVSLEDIVLE